MIAGFIRPDAGRVLLEGADVTGMRPDRICARGMVRTFQITQPFAGLTVAANIRVGAFLRTSDPAAAMATARDVGTQLGLAAFLDRPAGTLTVAGRKRLEVARALATGARFLLLDEVMAGLNPTEIDDIVAMLRRINAQGVTILLIEHIMQAIAALAEDVVVLAEGAVIARGTPREIAEDQAVIEAYLGRGAADRMAQHA
jgi:branched-chain amino acid transport system ATP-binding protein